MITFLTTDGISNFIETASLSVFVVGGAVGASAAAAAAAAVLHATAGGNLGRGGWRASHTLCSIKLNQEMAWRSGSVIDCHVTAPGSIPGGNGVKTQLYLLRKGQ